MKRLARYGALLLLLASCVAHEKIGDKASAVGDWRTAVQHYRVALANEPDSVELKEKYQRARQEALADASRKARACATAGNWACAVGEADYALELDPGNQEIALFRADAARSLALARLVEARQQAQQGNFRFALESIDGVRTLSSDAAVAQEAASARAELARLAEAEGERLRQRKAYPEALEALTVAATVDPARRPRLEVAQREYEAHLQAEYERLAKQGDTALARKDWAGAAARYQEALKMKPGGRAEPLARYAGGIAEAEAAVGRRDYAAATRGYRQAVESGKDTTGYAAAQLERVEVRPYTVRIRSVLARPLRPDGRPWVGRATPMLSYVNAVLNSDLLGNSASALGRRVMDAALSVPLENRPTLAVQAWLPDGLVLTTAASRGLYVIYDAEFVIATNALDERMLRLRVVHEAGGAPEDVGLVEFPLGEAVGRKQANLGGQSVARLELAIEPAQGRADGFFRQMRPLGDGTNFAQDYSAPTPGAVGYRLKAVRAAATPQSMAAEPQDGPPELVVELLQGGRVVYRSQQVDDMPRAEWPIANVHLFVERGEQLRLRVWDMDPAGDHDMLLDMPFSADQLQNGSVELFSQDGSSVGLLVEPRAVWAGDVMP